ncbi:hypothetical protein [Streptomyces sp. NPDC046821]|uniref:hypothetical protein n=1 Tax=Streptomyces sp. NPDC046821 TaxID=3154702 RepID=UPI0033D2E525
MLRRGLKLTALATVVVLALTGFSSRGHGGSGKSRGGGSHWSSGHSGGGCSSSKQDHDSSSSYSSSGGSSYGDDHDSYGSSGSSGYSSTSGSSGSSGYTSGGYNHRRPTHTPSSTSGSGRSDDMTSQLLKCATPSTPYATVELRNRGSRDGRYNLTVRFKDVNDLTVIERTQIITVPANGRKVAKVYPGGGDTLVQSIDHCAVEGYRN